MRKLLPLFAISCLALYVGCGGDDEPNDPDPIPVYRVVAHKASSAPSMGDAFDPIWSSATATTLDMKRAGALPQSLMSGPKVSTMQAIVSGSDLYLRFVWGDATNDIWRNGYYVSDDTSGFVQFRQFSPFTHGEDQLFIIFDDLASKGWDAWNWRAASLAPSGLAEDMWFAYVDSFFTNITADTIDTAWLPGDTIIDSFIVNYDTTRPPATLPHFVKDASTTQVPTVGWDNSPFNQSSEPTYVHADTSEFNDSVLYWTDAIDRGDTLSVDSFWDANSNPPPDSIWFKNARFWFETLGWTLNQRIPGYLIDTAAIRRSATELGSLYDIQSVSVYRGEEHVVVLRRALSTGNADDLNLNGDSVKTRIIMADNKSDIFLADTDRSISPDVWLILK